MADKTMKAIAVTELCKRAELRDMPMPTVGEKQVLVRTHYSGVSVGTEMWIAHGRRNDYGPVPFVNGYQVTGEIAQLGQGVEGFAEGDLVACFVRGAHGQYALGSADLCHKLSNATSAKAAALFVQPAVGANAINTAGINCGDTVVITGQGLIGQATAQLCRLRGAYVIAADVAPQRLVMSARYCADRVIDATKGPVHEQIKAEYPWGVDVVIESTGFEKLIEDALQCCGNKGKMVFEGWFPGSVTYNFHLGHARMITAYYPAFIGPRANQAGVIRLIESGKLDIEPLVSDLVPWRDGEAVYNRLFGKDRDSFNGIVFDWTA